MESEFGNSTGFVCSVEEFIKIPPVLSVVLRDCRFNPRLGRFPISAIYQKRECESRIVLKIVPKPANRFRSPTLRAD